MRERDVPPETLHVYYVISLEREGRREGEGEREGEGTIIIVVLHYTIPKLRPLTTPTCVSS